MTVWADIRNERGAAVSSATGGVPIEGAKEASERLRRVLSLELRLKGQIVQLVRDLGVGAVETVWDGRGRRIGRAVVSKGVKIGEGGISGPEGLLVASGRTVCALIEEDPPTGPISLTRMLLGVPLISSVGVRVYPEDPESPYDSDEHTTGDLVVAKRVLCQRGLVGGSYIDNREANALNISAIASAIQGMLHPSPTPGTSLPV